MNGLRRSCFSEKPSPRFSARRSLAVVTACGAALLFGAGCGQKKKPALTTMPGTVEAAFAKELTGGKPLRAVWLEDTAPEGAPLARRVFAFNTGDTQGIRPLGTESGDLARPLISPDGQAVVFTRLGMTKTEASGGGGSGTGNGEGFAFAPKILWQPWDGGPAKTLGDGMAVEVWKNPADGAAYIYAVRTLQPTTAAAQLRLNGETLVRFRVDKPESQEIVWTETPLNAEQFQLSRNGQRAAGAFPFPKAGLANLDNQTFTPLAPGGWAALAPDDSYAAAVLDGSRKRLRCFAPNTTNGWELTPAGSEGWPQPQAGDPAAVSTAANGGVLGPRWTNDARYLTFTGPCADSANSGEVRLARLAGNLRRLEKSVVLAQGRKAITPAVWIEGGGADPSTLTQEPVVVPKPVKKPWPSTTDGLVFAWESARKERDQPLPMAPASLKAGGFATVGRQFQMNLSGGSYEADAESAAKIAQACAASSGWSMELILTERTTQPPVSVRLAALLAADGREQFALYRVDRKLVLRVLLGGTPERPAAVYPVILTNLAIEGDRPVQVQITLRNNRVGCWVDGQMMKSFELESSGLAAWGPGKLIFGDPKPYGTPWTGWMERVAIYGRALSDEECRTSAATASQWTEGRTRPTRSKVQAKLVDQPAPASAAPVPASNPPANPGDSLSLSIWEVEQVFMGQVTEKRIAVAQWDQLRGVPVPPVTSETGKSAELWLESWDDHPELEGLPLRESPQANSLPRFFLGKSLAPPASAPTP